MNKPTKTVRCTLDVANPPNLTPEQEDELRALAAMPDEAIDFSDIPATTDTMWENAVIGKFYRPVKKQVTVRIDADILAWLQSTGTGYQTRLNQLLRDAMRQATQKVA